MCIHPFQITEIAIWNAFRFACNFSHRPQSRDLVSEIRNSSFYFSPSIVPSQFPGTLSCHRQTLRTQEKRTLGPYNCSETHMSSFLEIYLGKYLLKYKKRRRYFLSLSVTYFMADLYSHLLWRHWFCGGNISNFAERTVTHAKNTSFIRLIFHFLT